jgi:hypothetical protein
MKTKISLILIVLIGFAIPVKAQKEYKISVFYNYSIKFDVGKFYYPLGFGCTFYKSSSGKLLFSAGIEYAQLFDENQTHITPAVYRIKEIRKESIISITPGISYNILQKKLVLRLGTDLVASTFWNRYDLYRYTVADDALDIYNKFEDVNLGLGLRFNTDLEFHLTKSIGFFVQPGYTYYLFGEAKDDKFFNTSIGFNILL